MDCQLILFNMTGSGAVNRWNDEVRRSPENVFDMIVETRPSSFTVEGINRQIRTGYLYDLNVNVEGRIPRGRSYTRIEHGQYSLLISGTGVRMILRLSGEQVMYFQSQDPNIIPLSVGAHWNAVEGVSYA